MNLPKPKLIETKSGQVPLFTDDALFEATGVRIAFTERAGGVSEEPYSELNLSEYVGDDPHAVAKNRLSALAAVCGSADTASKCALLIPKQVHGSHIETIVSNDEGSINDAREKILNGADGLIVATDNVAAMFGFADCIPVIMVAPNGTFAVVHAGWRGVMSRIAPKALQQLSNMSANETLAHDVNIYIGPHIHGECFETSADIHDQFVDSFGESVSADPTHIDLNKALRESLIEVGADPQRIADVDICTMCNSDKFFSYRASGGECGRHGAIAVKVDF